MDEYVSLGVDAIAHVCICVRVCVEKDVRLEKRYRCEFTERMLASAMCMRERESSESTERKIPPVEERPVVARFACDTYAEWY